MKNLMLTCYRSEKLIEIVGNRLTFIWVLVVPKEYTRAGCHLIIKTKVVAMRECCEWNVPSFKAILMHWRMTLMLKIWSLSEHENGLAKFRNRSMLLPFIKALSGQPPWNSRMCLR